MSPKQQAPLSVSFGNRSSLEGRGAPPCCSSAQEAAAAERNMSAGGWWGCSSTPAPHWSPASASDFWLSAACFRTKPPIDSSVVPEPIKWRQFYYPSIWLIHLLLAACFWFVLWLPSSLLCVGRIYRSGQLDFPETMRCSDFMKQQSSKYLLALGTRKHTGSIKKKRKKSSFKTSQKMSNLNFPAVFKRITCDLRFHQKKINKNKLKIAAFHLNLARLR